MQYDPTAPGRPEPLDGAHRGDTRGDSADGWAGFLDPDHIDLTDEIDHTELAEAIAGAELAGAERAELDHEGPPIDYRDQGTTAATRPATRPPSTPPPPVHPPRPDPGPPPF